jgi:hypothetical protein
LLFTFYAEVEFWLYIHDEGEEFFLHYDYWPSVPPIKHVKQPEVSIDIVVTKTLEIEDEGCKDENYSYFGNWFWQFNF